MLSRDAELGVRETCLLIDDDRARIAPTVDEQIEQLLLQIVHKTAEQTDAEAEVEGFRRKLGPYVVAAETTRIAMVFTDAREAGAPVIFANDSFLQLTGYAREAVLGQRLDFLLAPSADQEILPRIDAAFHAPGGSEMDVQCRRRDGSLFWAALYINPVVNEKNEVVEHFASFVDLSKHKQEEQRLLFLLDELNHRTQNTLATVQSIAVQTLKSAGRPVAEAFEGRILALAKAHSLLGGKNWEAVGLRELLRHILRPFGLENSESPRFYINGPELRLKPKAAVTLAMVFHELAANAVAYGSLSNQGGGRVEIAWGLEAARQGEQIRLLWREIGGPPCGPRGPKGFGSRLIDAGVVGDLGGEVELDYGPTGLACRIVAPLLSAPLGGRGDA